MSKFNYKVEFKLSNGRSIHRVMTWMPEIGVCIRIPGTDMYGRPIIVEQIEKK
jgi:hypothetical protein